MNLVQPDYAASSFPYLGYAIWIQSWLILHTFVGVGMEVIIRPSMHRFFFSQQVVRKCH
jgi:hypothetical protein